LSSATHARNSPSSCSKAKLSARASRDSTSLSSSCCKMMWKYVACASQLSWSAERSSRTLSQFSACAVSCNLSSSAHQSVT